MSKKYLTNGSEYLGPDRLKMLQSYDTYIEKCDGFLADVKKYKNEVIQCKRSVIHSNLRGYKSDDSFENEKLKERDMAEKAYKDCFDIIKRDEKDSLFENSTVKSERIRIIRELEKGREVKCESLIPVGQSWFSRYYHLSKFIQIVRMTILKQRLEKRLKILKQVVSAAEKELGSNDESISIEDYKKSLCECPRFESMRAPCNRRINNA